MKKQQSKPISRDAVSEIKRHFDERTAETKRHFDVVAESVKGEVKIIAEQYGGIKKILDSHTEMIGKVMEDMTVVKMNIEFIKGALKKKVDYDEFIALERRVTFIEAKSRK